VSTQRFTHAGRRRAQSIAVAIAINAEWAAGDDLSGPLYELLTAHLIPCTPQSAAENLRKQAFHIFTIVSWERHLKDCACVFELRMPWEIVTESIGKPFWNEVPSIRKNVFYSHVAANAIKSVLFRPPCRWKHYCYVLRGHH